jgi:putative SOS response-associated peptidase YedK
MKDELPGHAVSAILSCMCGRYSLVTEIAILRELFMFEGAALNLRPRWNVAPTQEAPVIRLDGGVRRLAMLHWGLVPYWAEDPSIGSRMINARGETVAEKPAFKAAYRARRCLVIADGFYDWPEQGTDKRPYLFRKSDGAPFAFAGLWEKWVPKGGGVLETFTIVNCAAGPAMARIHSRTPVVVAPEDFAAWLDPEADPKGLIKPPPDDLFTATRVSTYVNKVAHDDSNCFTPAADEPEFAAQEAIAAEKRAKKKGKPVDDRQQSLF